MAAMIATARIRRPFFNERSSLISAGALATELWLRMRPKHDAAGSLEWSFGPRVSCRPFGYGVIHEKSSRVVQEPRESTSIQRPARTVSAVYRRIAIRVPGCSGGFQG